MADNKSTFQTYIKPTVVLMTIALIVSALIVVAYNLTYVDTTGVITPKLQAGCENVLGAGEYTMLTETAEDGSLKQIAYEGTTSVIVDDKGQCAIEVFANGYSKNGVHLLVGFDKDGVVSGVSVISLTETQGLGTRVNTPDFLGQFVGANDSENISFDVLSGASRSSNGVKNGVAAALKAYNENKEAIFSGK